MSVKQKQKAAVDKHALFSPSKLQRLIACPGSHRLTMNVEASSSVYAREGTMLHKVTEKCIDEREHRVPAKTILMYGLDDEQTCAVNDILE